MIDTSTLQGGWFIAMGAREFLSGPVDQITQVDWDNLIELRAFTPEHEIKLVRGGLGESFRKRDSLDIQKDKTRMETHYLDIDTTKNVESGGYAYAIGGGKYRLPEPVPQTIKVEIYYRADEKTDDERFYRPTGFYQPFDFRIVWFAGKGEA